MSYEAMRPLTDTEAFSETKKRPLWSRRNILAAGAVGLTSLVTTDAKLTQIKWSNPRTDVRVYETAGKRNGDMWVVLGGLGVQDSDGIMRALMPSLKTAQYAASVRYADTGLDLEAVADKINRTHFKLGLNSVHLFLHSMAGTMGADIRKNLDSSIPVGMTAYNCTPWTTDYIADKGIVEVIDALPARGTFGTKLTTQVIDRFFREQTEDLSFTEKLGVVWNMTNDSASPQTWLDQISYLNHRTIGDYGVIPENAQSIFVAPHDLTSDRVVLLPEALETYTDQIPGVKKTLFVPSRGHANPRQHPGEYNEVMRIAAEEHPLVFSTEWEFAHKHAKRAKEFDI